jgi:hypothetical protein
MNNIQYNALIFEKSTFDFQRAQSNSMHVTRVYGFSHNGDSSSQEMSPNCRVSNRPSSPIFSSMKPRELINNKVIKEHFEESAPESTEADSEEDSFESHFDAIDELSELFDSASEEDSCRSSQFARPSNPMVRDTQFFIPRCSAPAPVSFQETEIEKGVNQEKNFSWPSTAFEEELSQANYNRPAGFQMRPVAAINNPNIGFECGSSAMRAN